MGIFDVFKTKMSAAADKAGDLAGEVKDKGEDMTGQAGDMAEDARNNAGAMRDQAQDVGGDVHARAEDMVSEGSPPADGTPGSDGDGGLMGSIKDNAARGVEKAGGMADGATGSKYSDQIDTGTSKAKDMLGRG